MEIIDLLKSKCEFVQKLHGDIIYYTFIFQHFECGREQAHKNACQTQMT